jgi:hypothetical protein
VALEIDADAQMLYGMVCDLPRIGEWSPECESVTWEGDVAVPVEGTTFVGHNAVCFGALLPAIPQAASDLDTEVLQAGQVRWATIDSAWVHEVDRDTFGHALQTLRAIEPTMVCSSHLPPAPGAMLDLFVDSLAMTPTAERFIGPDQAALEMMLAGMAAPV